MVWKCKNEVCGKTFPIAARVSVETIPVPSLNVVPTGPRRKIVEKACCPYYESIEIEEVK